MQGFATLLSVLTGEERLKVLELLREMAAAKKTT
jgi:hypothetical protein